MMVEKETLNKSIKISEETYKKLEDYKLIPEETFNSEIKRLLNTKREKKQ